MTENEWLEIGYNKGIIDTLSGFNVLFSDAYVDWFCMKQKIIKPQSLDRIEVTYNKYYFESEFSKKNVATITDYDIQEFLSNCIYRNIGMSVKEFNRIWQIVNNVITYARDLNIRYIPLHDWDRIKRQIPYNKLIKEFNKELAVTPSQIKELMFEVMNNNVYDYHRNCSLLLCMNFYLGLRVGELASLTWSDFDFERNVLIVTKTESKFYNRNKDGSKYGSMVYRIEDSTKTVYSVREIPMLDEVKYFYELIKKNHEMKGYNSRYLAYDGEDTVFVRSLDRTLRRLCTILDIPYFSTHEIRKTFATMLHNSNVPSRIIANVLGHADISTTERFYIKSFSDNYNMVYNYLKQSVFY